MNMIRKRLSILVLIAFLLSACQSDSTSVPVETPSPAPAEVELTLEPTDQEPSEVQEDILYLNILWHQHQPLYYKNENGVYTRPWVRVHATKDYFDMASILREYPDIHASFNLTPVLIRQLDDFTENGAKDIYWVLSEVPADQLTEDQQRFILTRFFDVNWDNIIARFPRYQELLNLRGQAADDESISAALEQFTEQDYRDLQIWFNLAWFDPIFLEAEPLQSLVEQGSGFEEADKRIVFNQVREVMADVIPVHRELQEAGQIEVITTPYAHPILPLIYDTNLALVGNPGADMPPRFSWPNDAIAHLQLSVEMYQNHFGRAPRGLWPGEGAVAEPIVPLITRSGYEWMATGEPVLAESIGIGSFQRDALETVQEADDLYRPYWVEVEGSRIAVFFRDWRMSDLLGFEYSNQPGEAAAQDLMNRLENIRKRLDEQGVEGPHLVSLILDGENAWEYYENDGKEFLHNMYQMLSESETIQTVTPSEYLEMFPEQRELETLFPGAWFSPNYDTWIGETEERLAWEYLGQVRDYLSKYDLTGRRTPPSEEALAAALDYMYLAEGSDWFWWFGDDQDSGQDEYFDEGFRALLAKVYESLGDPVPDFVHVPIIPLPPVSPDRSIQGLSSPTIDGRQEADEWENAAQYLGTAAELNLGIDADNLYVRIESEEGFDASDPIGIYVTAPNQEMVSPFARSLL
jgi:alpha-amylase/alpha-mannosidase (GH57 family)